MSEKEGKKSLGDFMKESLDTIKDTAQKVKLPEIKLPEISLPSLRERIKKKDSEEVDVAQTLTVRTIPTSSALKVFYYLMAADGELTPPELEKFDLIGQELAPDYLERKEKIFEECQNQLAKVIDPEDYSEVLREGVEEALASTATTEDSFITPNLLVWNLLTLAYSDHSYNEIERNLLKHIWRKLEVEKAVFLEMESSYLALIDIENEIQWVKTIDRPYLTIEEMVKELEYRKNVVFDSVKDLIEL